MLSVRYHLYEIIIYLIDSSSWTSSAGEPAVNQIEDKVMVKIFAWKSSSFPVPDVDTEWLSIVAGGNNTQASNHNGGHLMECLLFLNLYYTGRFWITLGYFIVPLFSEFFQIVRISETAVDWQWLSAAMIDGKALYRQISSLYTIIFYILFSIADVILLEVFF